MTGSAPKIAVLDYGIGNLRSAEKALQHVGAAARLVTDPAEVEAADAVVLPGVGAFGACARALRESGLEKVARAAIAADVPFLAVCIGFQLLYEGSDENEQAHGLGVFPGRVTALAPTVKHPQPLLPGTLVGAVVEKLEPDAHGQERHAGLDGAVGDRIEPAPAQGAGTGPEGPDAGQHHGVRRFDLGQIGDEAGRRADVLQRLLGRPEVADAVVEHGDLRTAHRLPLVEGMAAPSTRTASRRQRATPLKLASKM